MTPDFWLSWNEPSLPSSLIFSMLKLPLTCEKFLRMTFFEVDFPTVSYSKLSLFSLMFTYGNLPIPLSFRTCVCCFSPSLKVNTAVAMTTLASSGVNVMVISFFWPCRRTPKI